QVDGATAEVAAAVRGKCPGSGVDGDVDVDVVAAAQQIVFHTMQCSLKNKLFSKIVCHLDSPTSLTIHVSIAEQEPANNVLAVIELKLFPEGYRKMMRLKNIRVDLCNLKRLVDKKSLMGIYYKSLRRAAANFPDKCPFKKNTTYSLKRLQFDGNDMPQYLPDFNYTFTAKFYGNNELGIEAYATGAFYEIEPD
ncbi:hypothetical protein KR018_003306, partial [Drosophila ironensis]